jgi:hypothetical protein
MSEEKVPLEGDPFENVTNNIEILRNQPQHETLMEAMMTKASTSLYEGSSTSILQAILLLNLKMVHGVAMFSWMSCSHYCEGVLDKREQNVNNRL